MAQEAVRGEEEVVAVSDGPVGVDCREQVRVGLESERSHGRRVTKVRVELGKVRHDADLRAVAEGVLGVEKDILLVDVGSSPNAMLV